MTDNVVQFPARVQPVVSELDVKLAYVRGGVGLVGLFSGAYFVGHGATLIVLGVLCCLSFITTMLRRDIVTVAKELDRRTRPTT